MIIWFATFLTAIGAINWGLTKFFDLNLVEYIGNMVKIDHLKEALYIIVSISGLLVLISLFVA
jgi:uncharacterized membrane protein YuzA (DUF378 family)